DRLVLAPQDAGHLGRHPPEHQTVGVDHVPGAGDVGGFRGVRGHGEASSCSPGDGKDYGRAGLISKCPSTTGARRRSATRHTTPLPTAATAPSISDQRVLYCSASHPASGPPMGVEPRKRIEYSAMTRPRMAGIEPSWRLVIVAERKAMPVAPVREHASAARTGLGAIAINVVPTPKATLVRARNVIDML